MADQSLIAEVRLKYIELSKTFFSELENGKSIDELQQLQEKIEHTLLQLDKLENDDSLKPPTVL
jgi:hypothetical protein